MIRYSYISFVERKRQKQRDMLFTRTVTLHEAKIPTKVEDLVSAGGVEAPPEDVAVDVGEHEGLEALDPVGSFAQHQGREVQLLHRYPRRLDTVRSCTTG